MPITITLPQPFNWVGAGLPLQVQSSFIGPPAPGSLWDIVFAVDPEGAQPIHHETVPWTNNPQLIYPHTVGLPVAILEPWAVQNATDVYTLIQLLEGTTPIDSGSVQAQWASFEGQSEQIWRVAQQLQGQGGFTETDRAAVQQAATQTNQLLGLDPTYAGDTIATVQQVVGNIFDGISATIQGAAGAAVKTLGSLFSGKTLDLVTTIGLGSACAPDVIDINVTGATVFALDVQVTSFPDYFYALPYADNYYRQTFGTVEIIRGGNVVHWHGLHTRSYRVEPLPGTVSGPVVLQLPVLPFDYRFRIVPAPGVCLTAQIDRLP